MYPAWTDSSHPDQRSGLHARLEAMQPMFWTWVALIVLGIVFFSIVGLSHR